MERSGAIRIHERGNDDARYPVKKRGQRLFDKRDFSVPFSWILFRISRLVCLALDYRMRTKKEKKKKKTGLVPFTLGRLRSNPSRDPSQSSYLPV